MNTPWIYHEQLPIDTPKETRKKYNVGDIFENACVCLLCNDYVRSDNRRDFKYCKCGNVAVDGGSWYVRRVGKDLTKIEEKIKSYNDVD